MVFCIALGVDDLLRGSLPALIYSGGGNRVTWKDPSRVLLKSYSNKVGLFFLYYN